MDSVIFILGFFISVFVRHEISKEEIKQFGGGRTLKIIESKIIINIKLLSILALNDTIIAKEFFNSINHSILLI